MPDLRGAAERRGDDAVLRGLGVRRLRPHRHHRERGQQVPRVRRHRQPGGAHPLQALQRQGWHVNIKYLKTLFANFQLFRWTDSATRLATPSPPRPPPPPPAWWRPSPRCPTSCCPTLTITTSSSTLWWVTAPRPAPGSSRPTSTSASPRPRPPSSRPRPR